MKKIFFLISITFYLLYASENKLIIDANRFKADDKAGLSVFTGKVKVYRMGDILKADKLEIFIQKNSLKVKKRKVKPLKYVASGHVRFDIKTKGKEYTGKGNTLTYNPKLLIYTIIGNCMLKQDAQNKTLYGDKITINQTTGEAKVEGSENKPVRFIMNLGDNKDKNNNTSNASKKILDKNITSNKIDNNTSNKMLDKNITNDSNSDIGSFSE